MKHLFSRLHLRISTRLTGWYGITLFVLLSLFALFCYLFFHASLHRDFDRHLTHEKRQLLPYIRFEGAGPPAFASLDDLRSVAYETDGVYGTYVRLLSTDGSVLYRSPNFGSHLPLPVLVPDEAEVRTLSRVWEGEAARTVYTPLLENGVVRGWLEVTGFEWSLHQELYRLRLAMLIGIVLSVLLAIGGGFLLARRALRPVATITEAANQIRATDLSARLPSSFGVRDELTDLAETFNEMIGRIESSFERERRFTDNAAHELLTPLTTLRNGIEIALRRERTPQSYRDTLSSMLIDVDEMAETVQGLLQLARVDRLHELPREPVDLSRAVREQAGRLQERFKHDNVEIALRIQPGVHVLADERRLGEIVENLVDNAVKYSTGPGSITVEVFRRGSDAVLAVSDAGIGFTEAQRRQLFDRFYRADSTEVQARQGSGLGLAVVESIAHAYGGSVDARSPGPMQGSRFEVRLPALGDGASGDGRRET